MRVARVQAQAKINLFLHVGAPQPTGFHDIRTLFLRLDLSDEIEVGIKPSGRGFGCGGAKWLVKGIARGEANLAYRAALAYEERARWPNGWEIEVTKRIPVGGGLGGGSSDAAAVLRALNALNPTPLSTETLIEIAAALGSDVPFLASDAAAAFAEGRGEKLVPIEPFPEKPALLVVPPFAVSTADAYRWLDEDRPKPLRADSGLRRESLDGPSSWSRLAQSTLIGNDFEPVVEKRHPELRRIREDLIASGARLAHLSGSGSTVFGIFDDEPAGTVEGSADARVIETRTSARVVQVEVLQ